MKNLITSLIFCVSIFICKNAVAVQYEITDLGTLGGLSSSAKAINDLGQVTGSSPTTGSAYTHAFMWDNGVITDLGTLDGPYSYPFDINNSGQIIGYSSNGANYDQFIWIDGVMNFPGSIGANGTYPLGSNNLGHYVGYFDDGVTKEAFLTNFYGTYIPLGTNGWNHSLAYSINEADKIVGKMFDDVNNSHACIWDNDTVIDLGVLGRNNSYARSINSSDQIVGSSTIGSGHTHAFFWEAGSMYDLGTLTGIYGTSYANAINDSGQVVGQSITESAYHAVIWENQELFDLNTFIDSGSGWTLNKAHDINNYGQIVGEGTINGETHAFLLTPYNLVYPVRISDFTPVDYRSLQAAYNDAADGDLIQCQTSFLNEDLFLDLNKTIIIEGGYDSEYSINNGVTRLKGKITISDGTVVIENFSL